MSLAGGDRSSTQSNPLVSERLGVANPLGRPNNHPPRVARSWKHPLSSPPPQMSKESLAAGRSEAQTSQNGAKVAAGELAEECTEKLVT
jgi:hypothetical protein